MFREAKANLKLVKSYFKFNFSGIMEYRHAFFIQSFGMALNNLSFIFIWWVLFSKAGSIGGYSFKDVLYIWALTPASFGLATILLGNVTNLSGLIMQGHLDSFLVQPPDPLLSILASKSNFSAWGDLLFGIAVYLVAYGFNVVHFLLFLIFILTGAMIFSGILTAAHLLTLVFGNASTFARNVGQFMINFSIYPTGIFPLVIRFMFYSVLPVGFMVHLPRQLMEDFHVGYFVLVVSVAILLWIGVLALFKRLLKYYQSGNLIETKL